MEWVSGKIVAQLISNAVKFQQLRSLETLSFPLLLVLYEVLQCFTRLRGAIAHWFAVCLLRCRHKFETRQGRLINSAEMAMHIDRFTIFISFFRLFFGFTYLKGGKRCGDNIADNSWMIRNDKKCPISLILKSHGGSIHESRFIHYLAVEGHKWNPNNNSIDRNTLVYSYEQKR